MKDGFFKNFKNLFGNKPVVPLRTVGQREDQAPRIINFGVKEESMGSRAENDSEGARQAAEEIRDTRYAKINSRYDRIETKETLSQLKLKKDEIVEGETLIYVDKTFVQCKLSNNRYELITLIQTDYKLFIRTKEHLTYFPLGKIEKLHKYTNNENFFKLLIVLKDGRKFKFKILTETVWKKIYQTIQKFAFVRVKKQFFAFKHWEANSKLEATYGGWRLYNTEREFTRMKIKIMPHTEDPVAQYLSDYKFLDNTDGKICSTYPEKIVVPARMGYDELVRCSKFRSRSRLPALTFVYEYEPNKFSSLYRSSQSKVGVQNSRSPDDERMLQFIGNHKFNPKDEGNKANGGSGNPDCIIYDARGQWAAIGNKMAGKGYQSQQNYTNCRLHFLNIPNIHVVRESYNKVLKASFGEDGKFFAALGESEWYDYVFLILSGAMEIVKNLTNGINVLVHCSDGWDRTAQLCSLAAIIIDPYYRTMVGFQTVIEKDWIRFGHQFAVRMSQGENNPNGQEKSQVFLQFLDCVSQLLYQFPSQFQFNYSYLQEIADLSYSHLYGNFLCNCEQEIKKNSIQHRTISLWSYLASVKDSLANPYFLPSSKNNILEVSTSQKHMRFWRQHFLQYVEGFRDIYDIYSCKFTQDNLEIMFKHLMKERGLLKEKFEDQQGILNGLDQEIKRLDGGNESFEMKIKVEDQNESQEETSSKYNKQIIQSQEVEQQALAVNRQQEERTKKQFQNKTIAISQIQKEHESMQLATLEANEVLTTISPIITSNSRREQEMINLSLDDSSKE